ncbi:MULTISPECIES: MaoC family dehydratase N-terminal domain-containing protein [unclassified Mesorhizobium]|uniref:FAS1-like dehydratase domain-containing protein n=1 Tax=unclassified Mesorhizobium TaxID=325217 RepID=UPI00333A77E6
MSSEYDYSRYVGLTAPPTTAALPLEQDTLRRFVQAIMDDDPIYYNEEAARASKYGEIVAPPFYPLHAFRRASGTPDPLEVIIERPDADGAGDGADAYYGLEHIKVPFNRILNGGIEVETYRCLRKGEKAVATPRYSSVTPKKGASGDFLLVTIETRFTTEAGELLMISRHTMVWR